jgi:hypothetical protein
MRQQQVPSFFRVVAGTSSSAHQFFEEKYFLKKGKPVATPGNNFFKKIQSKCVRL